MVLRVVCAGTGGKDAQDGDRLSQFENLFEHICPVILRLAVDVERVTRQLFEPLMLQLVRLYSIPSGVSAMCNCVVPLIPSVFFICTHAYACAQRPGLPRVHAFSPCHTEKRHSASALVFESVLLCALCVCLV